jgi:hypothetical protein
MTTTTAARVRKVVGTTITEPGMFEGQPRWTPHYYDLALEGGADEDNGRVWTFHVTPDDVRQYPELRYVRSVEIRQDSYGFVTGSMA